MPRQIFRNGFSDQLVCCSDQFVAEGGAVVTYVFAKEGGGVNMREGLGLGRTRRRMVVVFFGLLSMNSKEKDWLVIT